MPESVWQVVDTRPGEGVRLREVPSGRELFAHDVSLSRGAVRSGVYAARVYPCGGRFETWGVAVALSPADLLLRLE